MNTRQRTRTPWQMVAPWVLTATLLAACGGNDTAANSPTETAAVQVEETEGVLSVRTVLADSAASSVTQALRYTLVATAGGAQVLQGTLALNAETEDNGALELEGRLTPTMGIATPSTPSAAAIEAFNAKKAELREALRAAVDAARQAFDAARAAGTDRATARAAFRSALREAMDAYQTALAAAAQAAGLPARGERSDRGSATGKSSISVEGTVDTQGAVVLTVKRKGDDGITLSGTTKLPLGAAISGTFTMQSGNGTVNGTWTATPLGDTAPPPVDPPPTTATPCAAQTITWTVGANTCTASLAATNSGVSRLLSTATGAATTGAVTATCTNGVVTTSAPTCTTTVVTPPVAVGNVANGQAKYAANCSGCHGQGKASDTKVNTATKLASVMNSVGSHAGLRSTLTEQDRLDIAAYVASPK